MTGMYHHTPLISWDGISLTFFPRLAWNHNPPNLYLLSSWVYTCKPLYHPSMNFWPQLYRLPSTSCGFWMTNYHDVFDFSSQWSSTWSLSCDWSRSLVQQSPGYWT
jgi:hypothetical protein